MPPVKSPPPAPVAPAASESSPAIPPTVGEGPPDTAEAGVRVTEVGGGSVEDSGEVEREEATGAESVEEPEVEEDPEEAEEDPEEAEEDPKDEADGGKGDEEEPVLARGQGDGTAAAAESEKTVTMEGGDEEKAVATALKDDSGEDTGLESAVVEEPAKEDEGGSKEDEGQGHPEEENLKDDAMVEDATEVLGEGATVDDTNELPEEHEESGQEVSHRDTDKDGFACQFSVHCEAQNGELDPSFAMPGSVSVGNVKDLEIFVGRLPKGCTEEDITVVFSQFGEIVSAEIVPSAKKKNNPNAFVRYMSTEAAKKAVAEFKDGVEVAGKRVIVTASRVKNTLYLKNICKSWTKEQVLLSLKSIGIEEFEMTLPDDPDTGGRNRGISFLKFAAPDIAKSAFQKLQQPDALIDFDRSVKEYARPPTESSQELAMKPKLIAVSNKVAFANPKAPVYPRLAQGKSWNEMTVTWTSGYDIKEAVPFVEWGEKGGRQFLSPAGTLTFDRNSMCGAPARTVGWRHPGYIHTSYLKELWPDSMYTYRLGHRLPNGTRIWSKSYSFKASPYPGQDSLQRVVIFGDMGKAEADGSNEYNDFQPGSLNTTNQIIRDLDNVDMVVHIGDICYANGYLSQWDQFTAQIEPIASTVPYMIGSGNHERDWPGTGSFYGNLDSGGECGVPAQTVFYTPAENRAKFWYATDYGMFRFCIAHTEEDWRPGTEQYKFIEHCLSSVDRQKQPWLIFLAHRVLGYSSNSYYAFEGTFEEPMGREALQELWQKYKVDLAFYGHVHNYERTCPVYQSQCVVNASNHYSGPFQATTHVVVGGAGASLSNFISSKVQWSHFRDFDHGFAKLTAFNHSSLLFEYKKSCDGNVYDHFTISRDYRDVLACSVDNCPRTSLAS